MSTLRKLLWGGIARLLHYFLPIEKDCWVFGSDYGKNYREGSKYLMEYILKNHSNIKCYFITQDISTYNDLKSQDIPVLLNLSFKGVYYTAIAECVFTCQYLHDVIYTYRKPGRKFYYLLHGMPYKRAMNALSNDKRKVFQYKHDNILTKFRGKIADYFILDYKMDDVEFISVTSDFLVKYAHLDFTMKTDVRVLGMPRNDALFNENDMNRQKWISGIDDKFVITYMPTHRAYGRGELSPNLFSNNIEAQKWMKDHNVVLLIKQHPNMIPKIDKVVNSEIIRDITHLRLDPQVCIFHSDILITDYSSVWMDYLLLQRPLVFYYYDDFEGQDVGVHYDIRKIKPGYFCYSENDLFELIKEIYSNYDDFRPKKNVVETFHKYIDGKSCERYYNEIINNQNERNL